MKTITLLVLLLATSIAHSQILTYDKLKLTVNVDTYYNKNSISKTAVDTLDREDRYITNYFIDQYFYNLNYTALYEDNIRLYNASITADYLDDDVKGRFTFQYGDIQRNLNSSPSYLREAYAGFSPVKDLWLEAGIFFAPFSAEPLLPGKNFMTSTALQSRFEPKKMEAAKVTYNFMDYLSASFILANGYEMGNSVYKNKSFGLSINYAPLKNLNVQFNNLTGNVRWFYFESFHPYLYTEPQNVLRIFNNLNLSYKYNKFEFLSGIDYVVQKNSNLYTADKYAPVFAAFLSAKYNITEKFSAAVRGEYVWDRHGIFTFPEYYFYYRYDNPTGMDAKGFAFGLEYRPKKQVYARIEMNYLDDRQRLGLPASENFTKLTGIASMGINF